MSAANKWVTRPGDRALADILQEYGRDHAQTKLMSGQWLAFRVDRNTCDLQPIPAIIWGERCGRSWLEDGASWSELRSGGKFGIASYAVIVRIPERPQSRRRKAPQMDRIKPAIAKLCPNGTDGIPTKVIHDAVVKELKADSKKQGLADPSETSVKRALGRRK